MGIDFLYTYKLFENKMTKKISYELFINLKSNTFLTIHFNFYLRLYSTD